MGRAGIDACIDFGYADDLKGMRRDFYVFAASCS